MSAIPGLKKKLKSVRTTGKLSKAMKTVSAAKFSRLSALWKNYSLYAGQFRFLYEDQPDTGTDVSVVMGSARGFCGGFNNELLRFYRELDCHGVCLVCGEELQRVFREAGLPVARGFSLPEVPGMADCEELFACLEEFSGGGPLRLRLVYPSYRNTLVQEPVSERLVLHPRQLLPAREDMVYLPDAQTVMAGLYEKGSRAIIYGAVLSTALGAQAATLMTMRSACDTAEEYSEALEGEIHRLRQSEVTSDVLETSSERGAKGEEANGQA